jgi:glucosamine kinase
MGLYLAIDSGGTKTRCLLADETRELARASAGSVKLTRVGEVEATARLRAMLTEVSTAAGVGLHEVTRTCAGLGGFSIDAVREWGERELASAVGGDLILCGDEDIALDGAFEGGPGILVIAGTGSKVAGRAVDGAIYNSGGWGHAIGDEGSGYWIGQEALRAGFWAKDRGIATDLLDEIGAYWSATTLGDLVGMANALPPPDFAALCPVVVRCAENSDELAVAVLERAGDELADLVGLVALKMKESGEAGKVGVAYIGSVLEHISLVRASMIAALKRSTPEAVVMEGAVDGLLGALWRARNDAR